MAGRAAPNQEGKPGYEGYLNHNVVALPQLFQDGGYNTYMTGKWHLGSTEETSPVSRGFDSSFSLLPSGAGHFANMLPIVGPDSPEYSENGNQVAHLPEDFYSTH